MRIVAVTCALLASLSLVVPGSAFAGGNEFPGDGVRGTGRGGTGFTRADDPYVMVRNPALLADLWGDQALIGWQAAMVESCMQPTGGYQPQGDDALDLGDGPFNVAETGNATDLDGNPLPGGLFDVPYPEVCYQGPIPFLPQVGLTMKLTDDIGVGIGFFPHDSASLAQFGNRDGTVESGGRLLPNPQRYGGSHLNTSFFSLQSAIGYRVTSRLRVGIGFKWSLLALDTTTWSNTDMRREVNADVRVDLYARDLFIPGITASAQYTPIDALDIAVGFRWEDRLRGTAKLDLTAGPFGYGAPFPYLDEGGNEMVVGARIPTRSENLIGTLNVPPIVVPQLSFGVRWADRIKPRIENWSEAKKAAGSHVEDHMSNELWDIEAVAIVYFNGFRDRSQFTTQGSVANLRNVSATGNVMDLRSLVGFCVNPDGDACPDGIRRSQRPHGGNTQVSLRVGGDYNVMPGLVSLRTGLSYETSGSDIGLYDPRNYDQERVGVHAGWTLRVADATDLTFAWAMFFHPDIYLAPNDFPGAETYRRKFETEEYNWIDPEGPDADKIDAVAKAPVPNRLTPESSPQFYNHGSYTYDLQVFSLQLSQHF